MEDRLADCQVAIIGAGPIGLMCANLLGAAGVDVLVLERNDALVGLPRAIAYDPETLRLFAQVGLFEAIADGLIQDPRVVYLNARGRKLMEMNPPRSLIGHSQLGTFYQPSLELALLDGLSRFNNARAAFAHTVVNIAQNSKDVDLLVDGPSGRRRLRAEYVVACDGGASATRQAIGARLVGSTYAERWLVIDALVDDHNIDRITFFCDPRRPAVQLPAVGKRVRWEFMQLPGESAEELSRDATVKKLLAPFVAVSRVKIERQAVYAFHARVADKWRQGRVFLAGDAAHLMPPFAGQGMNGGMKDAANLGWKLAAVLLDGADPSILDTYEIERARSVRAMVNLSRRLGAVIMPTNSAIAHARDAIFAALNLSNRFRSFILRGGVLPPPHIARSVLTGGAKDRLIGEMLPQPTVADHSATGLFDQWAGRRQWIALGIGVDPVLDLTARDRAILERLNACFICINGEAGEATLRLRCEDQQFIDWVRRRRVRSILIRPDRFIAERLDPRADLRSLDLFQRAGAAARSPAQVSGPRRELQIDPLRAH